MSQINKIKSVGVSLTRGKGCQGSKGGNLGLKEGQQGLLEVKKGSRTTPIVTEQRKSRKNRRFLSLLDEVSNCLLSN